MVLRSANTFQTPFKCQTSFPLTALQKYSGKHSNTMVMVI